MVRAAQKVSQAQLPLWSGTKDSAFSAEQWVERIDKARHGEAGNWNDVTTMSYVFNALRGDALVWFDALPTLGYNTAVWAEFKEAFIRTYGTTKTARTAALNLSDIRQGSSESAARYISRVIKLISDVKDLAPANLPAPAAPYPDEIRALAGWDGVADAIKTRCIQALLQAGAQDAYNRVGMQLFIAGLKPTLRVELMKSNPANMREAFDAVIDAEKISAEPQKQKGAAILAGVSKEQESDADSEYDADEDNEEGEESAAISALSAKLKALKKKAGGKKKKQANKQSNGSNGFNGQKRSDGARGGSKVGSCRYCKKEGHFQAECYSRKAAGAPMVDAQGTPFKSGGSGGVHALQGGYMHHPLQQQQHQQQPHNPYAHYTQNEQTGGGGVGAIWSKQPWEQVYGADSTHLNY